MSEPKKFFLKDYQAPNFEIINTELYFQIENEFTLVRSRLEIKRTDASRKQDSTERYPLVLNGEELELLSVKIDGKTLSSKDYILTSDSLSIVQVPNSFTFESEVKICPQKNTSLEGLYSSGEMLCTQCEAQGFRRITYYLDRPDVMSKFKVTILADQKKYPILLSNGDRTSYKIFNDKHEATWSDPFKKPCYLFALVAGDLGVIKDQFITKSGKKVQLELYAEHGEQERCQHAMNSLKKSMKWDEERFGREYDLSTYMVVTTHDFNAGAMENKGLNIFNSRLILANPKTATDLDYYNIESVMAHEYFHNWTGNRVTLRDWFHLSLKEGLTVFRDQEFSMDMHTRSVVRIDTVSELRTKQFPEDAGPNAHPIRPESGYAVDNFFTSTIYEKGAEIIRMMQTMVGRPGFRKGMDLYFERHDGQAVIIEDFARAISDANGKNWDQFKLWYSQAGTPTVQVSTCYEGKDKTFTINFEQSLQHAQIKLNSPLHIPLVLGLLDSNGKNIPLITSDGKKLCPDIDQNTEGQYLLHFTKQKQSFVFSGINVRPVLSLNRQFSAPVHLQTDLTNEDLVFIASHDQDSFNRWESGQKLSTQNFLEFIHSYNQEKLNSELSETRSESFLALFKVIEKSLRNETSHLDPAMQAMMLELPTDLYIAQKLNPLNVKALEKARTTLELSIAEKFETQFRSIYSDFHGKNEFSLDPQDFGKRRLKNLAMTYLSLLPKGDQFAFKQFQNAKIMTDQESAFIALSHLDSPLRREAMEVFYNQWKNDNLVMNKWFSIQAQSSVKTTFEEIIKLWDHPDFNKKNPNRVYALLQKFGENLIRFHDPTKPTYEFMSDRIIELDKLNPQVATRISKCFIIWSRLEENQKNKAHAALEKMERAGLSSNTYEIVSKALTV